MHNIVNVINAFNKRATAVLTPEAMQAAIQPPMDPAAAGGMPPGGAPMGAPMDPTTGGMPPADPSMAGAPMAQGSGGGQIPPEVLNDQLFMQFMQTMGVTFDPQSGTFIDPNGQPLSVDEVMQIYDMFQQQVAAQGGAPAGGSPDGAAPADPAMAGAPMDPAAMGAPMGDPAAMGGMPPEAAQGMPPMDPAAAGAPMDPAAAGMVPPGPDAGMDPAVGGEAAGMDPMAGAPDAGMGGEDPIMEIASAVMTGVEATLQDFAQALEEKIGKLMDKIEDLNKTVESLEKTKDSRSDEDKAQQISLEDEIAADLASSEEAPIAEPVPPMLEAKTASVKPQAVNLFNFICQQKAQ